MIQEASVLTRSRKFTIRVSLKKWRERALFYKTTVLKHKESHFHPFEQNSVLDFLNLDPQPVLKCCQPDKPDKRKRRLAPKEKKINRNKNTQIKFLSKSPCPRN